MKQSERYFRQVKRHIPIGGLRKRNSFATYRNPLRHTPLKIPPLCYLIIMRTLENPRTLPCRFFPKCHTQK